MFILSSISSSLNFCCVNQTLIYEIYKLKDFKDIKTLGEIFNS